MRKKLFALMYVLVFGLPVCAVYADYQVTQGSGTTFFDFICFSSKHCPAHVNINSAGTEVGTSAAPLRVDPTGTTTQPVSSTTLMLDATGQSILTGVTGAVPAGSNDIGTVHAIQSGAWTLQPGNTPNSTPWLVKAQGMAADGATASGGPVIIGGIDVNDGITARALRPDSFGNLYVHTITDNCQAIPTRTYTPISLASGATTVVVAGTSSKKTYICGMFILAGAAINVGIVEGSGTTCGTSTKGVIGGTTAATGVNLVANQGFVLPNTGYAHTATSVNANDLCFINSAGSQVSGFITTVQN